MKVKGYYYSTRSWMCRCYGHTSEVKYYYNEYNRLWWSIRLCLDTSCKFHNIGHSMPRGWQPKKARDILPIGLGL